MLLKKSTFTCISFQPVVVIALVQAAYNVRIRQDNVLAMLDTKALNVMLLAVVIIRVQVAQLVMLLQVNVLAILATQVPHVILVLRIIIEQVEELVQVSFFTKKGFFTLYDCNIFSLWL